jgi:hypothetical protein
MDVDPPSKARAKQLISLDWPIASSMMAVAAHVPPTNKPIDTALKSGRLKVSLRASVLTIECHLAADLSFLFKLVSELSDKDNFNHQKDQNCDQHICRKPQLSNYAG